MSDDDPRPRCMSGSHGHLNAEEVEFVREGFENGRWPSDVARDLGCGRWAIRRRYKKLRAEKQKESA